MPENLIVFISQNAADLVSILCLVGLIGMVIGFALTYSSRPGDI